MFWNAPPDGRVFLTQRCHNCLQEALAAGPKCEHGCRKHVARRRAYILARICVASFSAEALLRFDHLLERETDISCPSSSNNP